MLFRSADAIEPRTQTGDAVGVEIAVDRLGVAAVITRVEGEGEIFGIVVDVFGHAVPDVEHGVRIRKVIEMKKAWEKRYTLKEIVTRCGFNSMETYYRVLKKYKSNGANRDF